MLGFGAMKTVLLLICSNVFMTIAWYGHLKYKKAPLIAVIVVSWLIAFFEYCFQVPANRIGYGEFTAFQLKIIQEVITLCVFVACAWIYLGEQGRWNHIVSFLFIVEPWYLASGASSSWFMQLRCSIDFAAIPDKITGSNTANNHGRAEILGWRVLDPPLLD
jgi:uncharacterized protein (DUF486 family)